MANITHFDLLTREIDIKGLSQVIIVMTDNNSSKIKFIYDVTDDFSDVATKINNGTYNVWVKFLSPSDYMSKTLISDITYTEGSLSFVWNIPKEALAEKGSLQFAIEILGTDFRLSTKASNIYIYETVNKDDVTMTPAEEAWMIQYDEKFLGYISQMDGKFDTAINTATEKASQASQSAIDANTAKESLEESQATIANAVLKTAQTLTNAEQAQVRANIGVRYENSAGGTLVSINDARAGTVGLKIYGSVSGSEPTSIVNVPTTLLKESTMAVINNSLVSGVIENGFNVKVTALKSYADANGNAISVSSDSDAILKFSGMNIPLKIMFDYVKSKTGMAPYVSITFFDSSWTNLGSYAYSANFSVPSRSAHARMYFTLKSTSGITPGDYCDYKNLRIIPVTSTNLTQKYIEPPYSLVSLPSGVRTLRGVNLGTTAPDSYTYTDGTNYYLADVYDCSTGVLTRNIDTAGAALATPTTETLATTDISALAGVNNICATGGTVAPFIELDYPLDLKIYTDNKYAELAAAFAANGGN